VRNIRFNLQKIEKLADGLWSVGQVFDWDDFEYIKSSILDSPDTSWNPVAYNNIRFELKWEDEGLGDELFSSTPQIIPVISKLVENDTKLKNLAIWKDTIGFTFPYHIDEYGNYDCHLQVYIHSASTDVGTDFFLNDGKISLPFIPNTAYINTVRSNIPHGMMLPVSESPRFSIDFMFENKN
jgi:hypothetical protein